MGDGGRTAGLAGLAVRTLESAAFVAVALLSFAWPVLTLPNLSNHYDYSAYRLGLLTALSPALLAYAATGWRYLLREKWLIAALAATAWGTAVLLLISPTGDLQATLWGYHLPPTQDGLVLWWGTLLYAATATLLVTGDTPRARDRRDMMFACVAASGVLISVMLLAEILRGMPATLGSRASGPMHNPLSFASAALLISAVSFLGLLRSGRARDFLGWAGVLMPILAMVGTISRGGVLGIIPLSSWAAWRSWRAKKPAMTMLVLLSTAVVLSTVFMARPVSSRLGFEDRSGDIAGEAIAEEGRGETTFNGREQIWLDSAALIAERPLGWGLIWQSRGYSRDIEGYPEMTEGLSFLRAHGLPLDIMLVSGVPGLFLLGLALTLRVRASGDRILYLVALAVAGIPLLTYYPDIYVWVPMATLAVLAPTRQTGDSA